MPIKLYGCQSKKMSVAKTIGMMWVAVLMLKATTAYAEINILPQLYEEIMQKNDIDNSDISKYKNIFWAIEKADFAKADELANELDNDILLGHVEAEKYLHAKYKSSCMELENWLEYYYDLPQAERIYKLALRKGCKGIAGVAESEEKVFELKKIPLKYLDRLGRADRSFLVRQAKSFRSYVAKGKTLAARNILENKRFQKLAPKPYWDSLAATLATKYLTDNYDKKALEWGIKASKRHNSGMATWVAGLAAWRLKDYKAAASYFARLGSSKNSDIWLKAAASYWSARAYDKLGNHLKAQEMLKLAAKHKYTFYGILAAYQLGEMPDFSFGEDKYINDFGNRSYVEEVAASRAIVRALVLIGAKQEELAEQEMFNAYDSLSDKQKEAVILIANEQGMHSLVIAIGRNKNIENLAGHYDKELYPLPKWFDDQRWQVDQALILALIRQESAFKDNATSRAGARGLMQLMPNTAYHITGDKSIKKERDRLLNPEYNLRLGQQYISYLLNKPFIEGNLFFMLTAYNGGPSNLVKWQKGARFGNDPLLFIEVLPAAETRIYIERVMANYWIYNLRFGKENKTLEQVANGQWPIIEAEDAFSFD